MKEDAFWRDLKKNIQGLIFQEPRLMVRYLMRDRQWEEQNIIELKFIMNILQEYQLQECLGNGSYGIVHSGVNVESGKRVAIKMLRETFESMEECLQLREVKALMKMKEHPNIIKLLDSMHKCMCQCDTRISACTQSMSMWRTMCTSSIHRISQMKIGQSIQYCSARMLCSTFIIWDIVFLYQRFLLNLKLLNNQILNIINKFIDIAIYINYIKTSLSQKLYHPNIHIEKSFIQELYFHRDIKPENILIQNECVKLIDFGLSREVKPPFTDYVSTRWYRAPEILLHSTSYDAQIDIFALGCVTCELFLGRPLFVGASELEQFDRMLQILGTFNNQDWSEGVKLVNQLGLKLTHYPQKLLHVIKASPMALDLIWLIKS